jgi:hypothetical protein
MRTTDSTSRPVYLSQPTIEDSLRSPSYIPSSNTTSPVASATSQPTTPAASAPRTIYPPPNLQAVNSKPVKEQSNIFYRSANGTVPQYGDPRSSFGQSPQARFRNASRASTTAPAWNSNQPQNTSSERVTTPNFNSTQSGTSSGSLTQPTISPGTVASSEDIEKLLPPIRGYDKSTTSTASTSTPRRYAVAPPSYSGQTPAPVVWVASKGDGRSSTIASRPSRSTGRTTRLSYETPAGDESDTKSTVHRDTQVQPVQFTPRIRYSHNEDYSCLRGELELSHIDKRWKIRYIPATDGKTDDYGGSLFLNETEKLSGFERGDFIEVRGRILSGPQADVRYERSYEIQDIRSIK